MKRFYSSLAGFVILSGVFVALVGHSCVADAYEIDDEVTAPKGTVWYTARAGENNATQLMFFADRCPSRPNSSSVWHVVHSTGGR